MDIFEGYGSQENKRRKLCSKDPGILSGDCGSSLERERSLVVLKVKHDQSMEGRILKHFAALFVAQILLIPCLGLAILEKSA